MPWMACMITVRYAAYWLNTNNHKVLRSETLHISNGDCAVDALKKAGITGTFLPWRDVLHWGPVPATDDWQAFDAIRVKFLSSHNLADDSVIKNQFDERRKVMSNCHQFKRLYLWFEADLYDQLQLLQVLVWLQQAGCDANNIQLIVTDLYLGPASEEDIQELLRFSETATAEHFKAAKQVWLVLTDSKPRGLASVPSLALLPFVKPAMHRLCQEFPDTVHGLGRIQLTVLQLAHEPHSANDLFKAYQQTEAEPFLGDAVFYAMVRDMLSAPQPLLKSLEPELKDFWQQPLITTDAGTQVTEKQINNLDINPHKQWLGGVHNQGQAIWCYDNDRREFILREVT